MFDVNPLNSDTDIRQKSLNHNYGSQQPINSKRSLRCPTDTVSQIYCKSINDIGGIGQNYLT